MPKNERCERCPDEDTVVCQTCDPDAEQTEYKLTYTFYISEAICEIDGIHVDLDNIIGALGFKVVRSTLESPDEICEHDYGEGVDTDAGLD
jgi:hypothetical protein